MVVRRGKRLRVFEVRVRSPSILRKEEGCSGRATVIENAFVYFVS